MLSCSSGRKSKGATRWLNVGWYNFQPSEFVKPAFACVTAWMFSEQQKTNGLPGNAIALGMLVVLVGLVVSEPDVGQAVLITIVFLVQFFLAGLPLGWVMTGAGMGMVGVVGAYFAFDHVSERVNRFFSAADENSYQIDHALNAFRAGGLFGRGPGEGVVKTVLPDAHSDFIFAVAGEEFGMLACIGLLALFAFIVIRGLFHLLQEEDRFTFLATAGILTQFGLQADHQHGGEYRSDARKGHDPAVHQLWRLVAPGAWHGHGHGTGIHTAAAPARPEPENLGLLAQPDGRR